MKSKSLLVIISCFLIISCTNNKETTVYEYTSFPKETTVVGEVYDSLLSETVSLVFPSCIDVDDETIFLQDQHSISNDIIYEIDRQSNTLKRTFGRVGRAGDEILLTRSFRILNNKCYIFDELNSKILGYDLAKDVNSPCEKITIPGDMKMICSIYLCENKDIYYSTIIDTPLIRMSNYETNIQKSYLNLKSNIKMDNNLYLNLFHWQSKISYNEETKQLAFVSVLGDLLYLRNTDTGEEKYIIGPCGKPGEDKGDLKAMTTFVGFLNGKIYTIITNFNSKTQFKEHFINVFSLKGEPLIRYKLDKDINYLTYNKKENIFYALAPAALHQIIKYKLE